MSNVAMWKNRQAVEDEKSYNLFSDGEDICI